MHCVCAIKVIQSYGIHETEDAATCNFCNKPLTEATSAAVARLLTVPRGQKPQKRIAAVSKEDVRRDAARKEALQNAKIMQLLKEKAEAFSRLESEYSQKVELLPVETRLQIALLDNIQVALARLLVTTEQIVLSSQDASKSSVNTAARLPAIAAGLLLLTQDD